MTDIILVIARNLFLFAANKRIIESHQPTCALYREFYRVLNFQSGFWVMFRWFNCQTSLNHRPHHLTSGHEQKSSSSFAFSGQLVKLVSHRLKIVQRIYASTHTQTHRALHTPYSSSKQPIICAPLHTLRHYGHLVDSKFLSFYAVVCRFLMRSVFIA